MLSSKNRLKKKKDFEAVFKKGETIRGGMFFLKILNTLNKDSRIGFVVSKKISKKAVERNKIKRRLREALRHTIPLLGNSFDIICVALPNIRTNTFKEIGKEIEEALKRKKLINK
jgi:ribonuclease P protein component